MLLLTKFYWKEIEHLWTPVKEAVLSEHLNLFNGCWVSSSPYPDSSFHKNLKAFKLYQTNDKSVDVQDGKSLTALPTALPQPIQSQPLFHHGSDLPAQTPLTLFRYVSGHSDEVYLQDPER